MSKRSILSLLVFISILIISVIIVFFSRGYRVNLDTKDLNSTGLLVVTSYPDGASVFVDGKLKTATNSTINLSPGDYTVKITKEGYIPWEKKLSVQGEIVTKTEAELFPSTPELRPLTSHGVVEPMLSPDGSKIAYFVKNSQNLNTPSKDGIWILNISERVMPFNPQSFQVARTSSSLDWSNSTLFWSPDSKEILSVFSTTSQAFLIQADQLNLVPENVTATTNNLITSWEEEKQLKDKRILESLPLEFQAIASSSAKNITLSPDENKILYVATKNTSIPLIINPALLGTNTQPEERNIKVNNTYVYDMKEDKNFLVFTAKPEPTIKPTKSPTSTPKVVSPSPTPTVTEQLATITNGKNRGMWLATSRHIVFIENNAVNIMEYDSTNKTTVYGGPFENGYLFPHLSGSKLIILTNYNKTTGSTPNLYSINLK